jgi:predicted lysophospholipase L1 biosynthesis ABC-type transport system permease subunit
VNQGPAKPVFEVIGVVGDAKYRSLREPFHPTVYAPLHPGQGQFILHVRTRAAPERVIAPMRRLLNEIDPRLSFIEVTALADEVASSLWAERVAAFLAAAFAGIAAFIAAAGLYALVAFAVAQRQREIGIRVALGAVPRDVLRLFLLRALALAAAGAALGLAALWALAPRIQPLLFDVRPHEPAAILAAAGCALAVAAAAAIAPSARAARTDPAAVLRQE